MQTTFNNNYSTNTNYLLNAIAELAETQQIPNIITSAPVAQQEATPATKITKTIKNNKTTKVATIHAKYKSFTTQHGYFVPSKNETIIVNTTHKTTLFIDVISKGYTLECKINGVQQTCAGDIYYTNWLLKELQPNDTVEVTVIGGESTKIITYTINERGVMVDIPEGINHPAIKGSYSIIPDTQDKYRKEAQEQTVEVPAPVAAQEAPVQVEEITVEATPVAIDFGVNKGKRLSECSEKYLKWAVSHMGVFSAEHRWVAIRAKKLLEFRQSQQQQQQQAA